MDKVRLILGYAQKYHFWLLCGVATAAGLLGWYMARGALSQEYNKGKQTVVGKFDTLKQIQQEEFPPNSTWKEGIDKLTEAERQQVKAAWQSVYDEQQKVLEWPEVMGPKFKDEVMKWLRRTDPAAEFDRSLRGSYRNLVANMEFPKLPAIVGAKVARDERDTEKTEASAEAPDAVYTVRWDEESQNKVRKVLEMPSVGEPPSLAVWLKQEDLWVFRAVLNLIRKSNEGSLYTSRIKQISALSIGVDAATEFKKGMSPGKIDKIAVAGGEAAADSGAAAGEAPPEGGAAAEKPLDDGRYVDQDGNPLAGGAAQTSQFKRMPIHLIVLMDQREIPRLLTECANSPLPVEVCQMRINPDSDKTAGNSQSRPAAPPSPGNDRPAPTDPDHNDVTVEIHGVIYIYNPPDANKLGQGGAQAAAAGG